jgi:hypothetical protein
MQLCGILLLTPVANLPLPPSLISAVNLPLVPTTPVASKNLRKDVTPVANFPHVSLTPVALPVADLPPVLHLDLQKSQQIFEKILNDPNVLIRGLGEDDS